MFDIAVIIPCYNEASKIQHTFDVYFNYFLKNALYTDKKIAIVLVDDGSQDETAKIIERLKLFSNDRIAINTISYKTNQGKGAAIKRGCALLDAKIYGFTDADLSFRPELIENTLIYFNEYDLVIGQRANKVASGYSKFRNNISKLLHTFGNLFFSTSNLDTQCGFKFFKHNVAKNILSQIKQDRFSFDIELIIRSQQAGLKIKSIPVAFTHQNKSSITWRDGIRYILDAISISERLNKIKLKQNLIYLFAISTFISFNMYGWVIFKGFFFSDDFTWLWYGQKINNSLIKMLDFHMSTFYSPVLNSFYSIMYYIFHYNPAPFFLIGIIAHILVSILFGILTWQLSQSKLITFTVVFLASFAGNAYEPIVWISANMHSFVTLFILACLTSYYHYLLTKKNIYLIPAFLFFILAIGTKESAIITPALLLLLSVYYKLEQKKIIFPKTLCLFWSAIIFISGIYAYKQYLWQTNGIWVKSNVWIINIISFFRIPLIILDNFIPISFLRQHLTTLSAGFLWLFSVLFILFVLYTFKRIKLIWLSFLWLLIGISPFIFFKTESWWEPLASRYNYLPRFGAILVIATILHYLIINNKSRYIISGLIYFVIITTMAQIYFATIKITSEYDYVYNTGRSLVQAMKKINEINPKKIIVQQDHPFPANTAHIVGVVATITSVNENNIIFLQKNEKINLNNEDVLLYWNHQQKKYEIKQNK